ncbi:MAG: QueT transporter family protein [Clostridia bacterium]|nr:QueT transporter family protein [Clostridia bacterium]
MNKKLSVKGLVLTGLIAALYVVFTLPFGQIAFGPIQVRIAEVLTLLPFFTPWAIPGVTIGCLLSNLLFSTIWDAVFGTLATLIAAYLTYKSKHLLVAPVWPILLNGLIIGTMLTFMILGSFEWGAWLTMMLEVAASEFVICFAIGVPFMRMIRHYKLEKYLNV